MLLLKVALCVWGRTANKTRGDREVSFERSEDSMKSSRKGEQAMTAARRVYRIERMQRGADELDIYAEAYWSSKCRVMTYVCLMSARSRRQLSITQ